MKSRERTFQPCSCPINSTGLDNTLFLQNTCSLSRGKWSSRASKTVEEYSTIADTIPKIKIRAKAEL